jgi:Holliday junction resolvase RusA-like endonuclease
MSEVFFRYDGDPVAKPRMTQRDKWAKRPVVLRYRDYCDRLRELAGELPEGSVQVTMMFGIAMPKSWSKAKRAQSLNTEHTQKPDIDNLAKGVLDALFKDDSMVWNIMASKGWVDEPFVYVIVQSKQTDRFTHG